mmetsp:Transcript_21615/g.62935  ORF Transcript_21615/g.62935 Transcript_21615/m.62935 type:complete len:205 (-) Transcript_21615:105-719(-)
MRDKHESSWTGFTSVPTGMSLTARFMVMVSAPRSTRWICLVITVWITVAPPFLGSFDARTIRSLALPSLSSVKNRTARRWSWSLPSGSWTVRNWTTGTPADAIYLDTFSMTGRSGLFENCVAFESSFRRTRDWVRDAVDVPREAPRDSRPAPAGFFFFAAPFDPGIWVTVLPRRSFVGKTSAIFDSAWSMPPGMDSVSSPSPPA